MSGYLQRIAATAVMPKERVHPFVEPMFGAQRAGDATGRSVEAVTERVGERTARREPLMAREKSAAASAGFLQPTHDGEAVMNGAPEVSEPVRRPRSEAAPRERFDALLPEVVPETSFVHPTVRDTTAKDGASGPQRWDRRRDDEASRPEWTFEPLLGETARETSGAGKNFVQPARDGEAFTNEAPSGQRASAGSGEPASQKRDVGNSQPVSGLRSAAEMTAGRRLAQQQARARAEQQGNEIQIHIGRIEVTAMPPVAPRPMPVPVRKTQTLDEYLRRSSGSAG